MCKNGVRKPSFFTKEVIQDAIDTPVFPNGREGVLDLSMFSPAGEALKGLKIIYGLTSEPPQSQAIPLMRALLSAIAKQVEFAPPSELHDIQFMLCETSKLLGDHPGNC